MKSVFSENLWDLDPPKSLLRKVAPEIEVFPTLRPDVRIPARGGPAVFSDESHRIDAVAPYKRLRRVWGFSHDLAALIELTKERIRERGAIIANGFQKDVARIRQQTVIGIKREHVRRLRHVECG